MRYFCAAVFTLLLSHSLLSQEIPSSLHHGSVIYQVAQFHADCLFLFSVYRCQTRQSLACIA